MTEEWQKEFDTKFKGYLTLNKLGSEVFVYETDNPWELKAYIAKLLSQSHQQGRMEIVNKWLSLNLTNNNKENWDSELTKFGLYMQQIEQQSNPTHN